MELTKVRSVKVNYILNLSRLLLSVGVSLVTMPYINRILGSAYVGKVEYVYAIVNYFVFFSALGIPAYGIREIAKVRENKTLRNKVLLELLFILMIMTIISYVVLYILMSFFGLFPDVKILLILMSTGIFLSNIGVEWFYQGIEDQLYISIRHILIKIITIILLLCFVRSVDDYIIYGVIMIFSTYGGNLFNLFHLKNFISLKEISWKNFHIKKHIKPVFIVFIATASISVYTQINIIILKYFTEDKFVGYYTQADRLSRITLIFVTSLGTVMLPRLTYLIEKGEIKNYAAYANKSLKFILLVSIPLSALFIIYSQQIITVMAGEDFLPAITTLKITSINIFIVGLAYFLGFQVLYPLNKEKIYTISVTFAAVISLVLNVLIVSEFKHNGTAVSSVFAEIIGAALMFIFARKQLVPIGVKLFTWSNLKFFIGILIFIPIYWLIIRFQFSSFLTVIIGGISSFMSYFIILLLIKEKLTQEILSRVLRKS